MRKIPFTNETNGYLVIGTVTIPPGQTRDVEDTLHPDYAVGRSASAETAPVDIVAMLLAGPLDELLKCLPALSPEDLDRLDTQEQQSEAPRSEVISAITELQLSRADAEQQPVDGAAADAAVAKPAKAKKA